MSTIRWFALLVGVALCGACGPTIVHGLSSDDNNPTRLASALATRTEATAPAPANRLGKPLVFAVVGGAAKKLVAYDLGAGAPLWSVDADVTSRVAVGGDVLVTREGAALAIRRVADGGVRAQIPVVGELVGATTDGERVLIVTQGEARGKPVWTLAAHNLDGGVLWRNDWPGALGAPAAHRGLVLAPFLKQWLTLLDAKTGAQLTRIRGLDDEISMIRVTGDAAFFGAMTGATRLDERAATGSRAGSTYGTVTLPPALASATFGRDHFDPIQASYSAFDRRRVLWRAAPTGDGWRFEGDLIAVHFFRFVFGLTTTGELRWAYSHPRVELVASDHAGAAIVGVAADGTVVALDPQTGAVRASGKLEVGGPVLGATIDCDGWAPPPATTTPSTVAALATIARDRDARFEPIKAYAVASMAKLEGAEVSRDLIALIVDPRTPTALHDVVTDLLIKRRDPLGLPAMLETLSVKADFVAGTQPVGIVEVARALAALAGTALTADDQAKALAVLEAQAFDPVHAAPARLELVRALIAIGAGRERPILARELMAYRADPGFAAETDLVTAMLAALAAGGDQDRETVRMIAVDVRTTPAIAALAQAALAAK